MGCGSCTKAQSAKTLLQPGEDAFIEVIFTPGSTGSQNKKITVKWKDKEKEAFTALEFTAEVYA